MPSPIFPPNFPLSCIARYSFAPVGQGLFAYGDLSFDHPQPLPQFRWVFDCGAERRNARPLRNHVQFYRNTFLSDKKLELFMLSHFDEDHISGVKALLRDISVDLMVLPYLHPVHRLELAVAYGEGRPEYVRFLFDPVGNIRETLEGVQSIVVVVPGDEGPGENDSLGDNIGDIPPGFSKHPKKAGRGESSSNTMEADDPLLAEGYSLIVDGSNRFLVNGHWEFVFYNKPRPEREASLWEKVRPIFLQYAKQPSQERDYDALIRELKPIYSTVFGASGAARNDISLVTYSGPISPAACRMSLPYPVTVNSYTQTAHPTPFWPWPPKPSTKPSILYTGDITFNASTPPNLQAYLGKSRWEKIEILQVPHHGSKYSWTPGLGIWQHSCSVFSAGVGNRYRHPNKPVVNDLSTRCPILVNEFQGADWWVRVCW